jgi:alpha-glucosidase (family GH31 glycosyl hydrolase)
MTQRASNVLFAYWSHDIGGFLPGDTFTDELFLRWIQFGIFSPIFRTHSDHQERYIWKFPHFEDMKAAFLLRNRMVPYIYTAAYRSYNSGVGIVHPLYYDYPEEDKAYKYDTQYMFGDSILVSPVVRPVDPTTGLAKKNIWIPPGTWFDYKTLQVYQGPQQFEGQYAYSDIPLFIKAGAVIPLHEFDSRHALMADPLTFEIYPGAQQGEGYLYEDDGNSMGYLVRLLLQM